MKFKLQCLITTIIVLAVYIPSARAQANLTFSGGNGTPLSITLQRSVTYTINNPSCVGANVRPLFLFDEAGNPNLSFARVSGTITFSVDSGTVYRPNTSNSGLTFGDISPNDTYFYDSATANIPTNGSTITLNAGTLTTLNNIAAPPPANGSFTTFLLNGTTVTRCSTNGVAAPNAASVSVSGRVFRNAERGLMNASVYLTDAQGNTRTARTNSFGYYRFQDIAAGQTVVVSVVSKRHQFAPQVLTLNEAIENLDFAPSAP